jgi:hypothetical protein
MDEGDLKEELITNDTALGSHSIRRPAGWIKKVSEQRLIFIREDALKALVP